MHATSNRREHHRISEKERSLFCTPCEPKLQCLARVRLFCGRERMFASAPMKESTGPSDLSRFLPALSSPWHLQGSLHTSGGATRGGLICYLQADALHARHDETQRQLRACAPASRHTSAPTRATPPRNSCGSARPAPSRSTTQRSRGPPTKPPSSAS